MATKIIKPQPTSKELRFLAELRAADGDGFVLEGYAALFNSESNDLGGFKEKIAPGAFDRALAANGDVKCLFNHDANHVLGRTKSGTLTLSTDNRGLKFRCQLDRDNASHRNLYATVKRGDVDECSFAFTVDAEGQEWTQVGEGDDAYVLRTLKNVDLYDVSAVTYPAYPGTAVGAREANVTPEIRQAIDTLKRSLADLAQDHKTQADLHDGIAADHGAQAADHKKAAELLEKESLRMEKCSTSYGDCGVDECECQNILTSRSDAFQPDYADDGDDPENAPDGGNADDDLDAVLAETDRAARKAARKELRDAGKCLCKRVDGKLVRARHFAHVGDETRTQTWKLPLHTRDAVQKTIERVNNVGIPKDKEAAVQRKIRSAAKKFGIQPDGRSFEPMTENEITDALLKARVLCCLN